MANPTSMQDWRPARIKTSSTASSILLNPNESYTVQHTGKNSLGTADTGLVVLGVNEGAVKAYSEGVGQITLLSGSAMRIMNVHTLGFVCETGAEPMIQLIPEERGKL